MDRQDQTLSRSVPLSIHYKVSKSLLQRNLSAIERKTDLQQVKEVKKRIEDEEKRKKAFMKEGFITLRMSYRSIECQTSGFKKEGCIASSSGIESTPRLVTAQYPCQSQQPQVCHSGFKLRFPIQDASFATDQKKERK